MAGIQGCCPVSGCRKVFKSNHWGIDAHVVSAHGHMFDGTTKQDVYAAFLRAYPRPWPYYGSTGPSSEQRLVVPPSRPRHVPVLVRPSIKVELPPGKDLLVGVDFAGPREVGAQRRKILAVGAEWTSPGIYVIRRQGFNARFDQEGPPGWTAAELAEALTGPFRAQVVAMDFPFSLPSALLEDEAFARRAGHPTAFGTWEAFHRFVAGKVALACPLDLSPFAGWRDQAYWLRRATDEVARAQPALKHKFQVLFNMTLLGQALLAELRSSGYLAAPFDDAVPEVGTAIEVYPGAAMRALGRPDYKREPAAAIAAMLAYCEEQGVIIEVDPVVRHRCEWYGMDRVRPDPDASDAFIATCLAILFREGRCGELLRPEDASLKASEGAIWSL